MRIVIESTEQAGTETSTVQSVYPTQVVTLDGGAPSETLVQAIAEAMPTLAERTEIDAGSPPEWLVEAIQGRSQPSTGGSNLDIDAGGGPSS
jgi:hypothetical protein